MRLPPFVQTDHVPTEYGPTELPHHVRPSAESRGHDLGTERALVEGTDTMVEGVHLVAGAHRLPDEFEATVVLWSSPQVSSTTPRQTVREALAVLDRSAEPHPMRS